MQPIETITHRGLTIEIYPDDAHQGDSPLDWGGEDIWATWESRSIFASRKYRPFDEPEEAIPYAEANGFDIFPLYKYEHSGVAYSTAPFSCPWDSGQVGYILIKKENATEEWTTQRLAEAFVKTVEQWITGDLYGYVVEDSEGEQLDSCWGFYGMDDVIKQAKDQANWFADKIAKRPAEYQAAADIALGESIF